MPPETKQSPIDTFRDLTAAMTDVARALAPHCTRTEDLIGVLELAAVNDGQLALLMEKMDPKAKR